MAMKLESRARTVIKTNLQPRAIPITIFPRDVIFEDVQSHSCYEITLFIRNEGKQMEKLRIIEPTSKMFKIKIDENFTKTLAPGLTIKLNVFFMSEKLTGQTCFEDQLFICGNSFKEAVTLKAYPPREQLVVPSMWNLGRILVNRENIAYVPIKNEGKRGGRIYCEIPQTSIAVLVTHQLSIEAGQSKNIEIRIKNKKIGNFQDILSFSNGKKCTIKGVFAEESIDILNCDGQRLNLIDLGQVFIGQRAQQSFFVLNNTENSIECIFKTFHKNVEINDLKLDTQRGNFIIKSLPEEYAKQLKDCYTSNRQQKWHINKFQEFQNKLIVNRYPNAKQQRLFQAYANGQVVRQSMEQPIIQALVIKISSNKNYFKVPIKFISVFPRVKISESVLEYGEIKERVDNIREITIQNEGQRQIHFQYDNTQSLRIQTDSILKPRSSQQIKFILRAVKAGNISEIAKIKFFQGLFLEIKVFGTCRSSSIRAKKITNLNSARQLRKGIPLYQTLGSPTNLQKTNLSNMSELFNKTDALADLRTVRLNKLLKQHIQSEKQPKLKQPELSFRFEQLDNRVKCNPLMRKLKRDSSCPKLSMKQMLKYTNPLKIDQLSKIIIKDSEVSFGNVFINTELMREVKVLNNNTEAILFEWDFANNECLRSTNCQMAKIDSFTEKTFKIFFKSNSLGAISLPLQYIINRNHIFQTTLTAYVTLINVQISSKNLEYCFASLENVFQKYQELELTNKSQSSIKCQLKFQENKHFYVDFQALALPAKSQQKVKVFYRPIQGEELGVQRIDSDKLIIKVVGGAQNTIKCTGLVNDAKVTIKQSQIMHSNHLISTPLIGKFNIKNHSKIQSIVKMQVGNQLKDIIVFDKQLILLNGQQKREINYTIICHEAKKISSFINIHIRGTKTIKIPVDINFAFPEISCNREFIDFGNIPIMGNNYQETIVLVNMFKNDIKLEFSKKFQNEDYTIEIRQIFKSKTQQSLHDIQLRPKKKQSNLRQESKRGMTNQKTFRLQPNIEMCLEVKFIPKKLQQFDIPIPLKLSGTNNFVVQPVRVRLICCAIEPVVYLQPHYIAFDTRIIGEGKSSFMRSFQIRNPHQFDIDWFIDPQEPEKNQCFFLSEDKGRLSAKQSVHIEVMFKPQQEGHFFERMDVVLKQKKTSHISLELQGNAILPSIKFNCNELLMPVVPLGVESKAFIILQNHGYDAITISKWKTATHFQQVDISVNFIEGKLLSLAKKYLKVEVITQSSIPISFTTFLEFYDEFGNKYEVPISFTADNSIMTTYPYIQMEKNIIFLEKKQNVVKISNKNHINYEKEGGISAGQLASCEFIKNWLNYEVNLSIKKFPYCIIDSEGELIYRMINRISNLELVRRFQGNNNQAYYNNMFAYYSECIKAMKIEGAFLNQIRPEFLLSYKDYKSYLYSKNAIVEHEQNFEQISINSWIALFYQLIKLYVEPHLNQKMINKLVNNSTPATSVFYSSNQLLVFRFLNAFNNDQPFYDFGDQIKFFQVFQHSFQKGLNLNFINSLISLKISSVVMTPSLYMVLISKFLNDKLKQYGLCQFLTQTDLFSLGAKQLILTMISYISMLYHYSNTTNVCFEASIGDKITKIIEIENPVSRKAKYRLKIEGSEEFQLQNQEINIGGRGKAQARVAYHCKQNKSQQAKLLLIPVKEDNASSVAQPMSFKLTTSILSKITLKKLQITAHLYEVTTITLEVQLPMDIIDLCEFNVSLNEAEEGLKSFYCFSQMTRILRNNHDKLQIKLVPLTLEPKFCRVCYRSSTYGQFNFEITAKIQTSPSIKQLRLKQLKVNKDQVVSVYLPKDNQQLSDALRFLNDHHIKLDTISSTKKTIPLNKYSISIVESSYISILDEYSQIARNTLDGKDNIRVDLKCLFGKPFTQYTCTMMVRNDILKDLRFYKLTTSVAMKPKIVPISVRTRAQESVTVKIPIKIAPCQCSIEGSIEQFSLTNFNPHVKQNTQFIGVFTPDWILDKQVNIIAENRQTLEQVIYCITLKVDEPAFFDNIKIEGSIVFPKKVRIPINLSLSQDLRIECNSKRILLDDARVTPQKKWINAVILPSNEEDMSNIKLVKQKNGHYFWASLFIGNKKITESITINLQEKPNAIQRYLIQTLPLGPDYQINFQPAQYLNYQIVSKGGSNYIELIYSPQKEMETSLKLHLMISSSEYVIQMNCKSPALPIVVFPEIFSYNLAEKFSSLILLNPSDLRGIYRATIEPSQVFSLDNLQFQLKGHEKKEIKIYFTPITLQTRYKAILRFQCETLPTYQYHLNGISQFDSCERTIQCEIYSDREVLTDLHFTNHFSKSEDFIIDSRFELAPFELVEPTHNLFRLEAGSTKKIIVKSKKCERIDMQQGLLEVRLGERRWKFRLVPIVIKSFTSKKYSWHCKARDTLYENIQLPSKIVIKSLESPPEITPYLTFSIEQGTNTLKLKYSPLKPVPKQQYQIFLLAEKSKYVINCVVSVSQPEFDDIILIKTKEINQCGCVMFKLTNIKKMPTPFKAYFMKGQPDLTVQTDKNILEGYGRPGTAIKIKFTSNVYNKRAEDELWIETSEMLWRFKVKGILSKKIESK